jgi:hypothetical protein
MSNTTFPVVIPTFNCLTYLPLMLRQLWRYGITNIVILDNNSRFPPFIELLDRLEHEVTIIRLSENRGPHHAFLDPQQFGQLPQHFCITDPDLLFNESLPPDFMSQLTELTYEYRVGKAGFALDISDRALMRDDVIVTPTGKRYHIWEWEEKFWQTAAGVTPSDDPVYHAAIDTTFAVYNKSFFDSADYVDAVRVAGRYTCKHLPWYRQSLVGCAEARYYRVHQRFSCFTRPPDEMDAQLEADH